MTDNNFSLLYDNIYYDDIKEYVQILIVTSKMLSCNLSIEYRASIFHVIIKTLDKKHKMEIDFHVNIQKKYLQKVNLTHTSRKERNLNGFSLLEEKDRTFISSGNITNDLMIPLEKAMDILIES